MTHKFIFFQTLPLVFNMLLLASDPLIEALKKLFFDMMRGRASVFNILLVKF